MTHHPGPTERESIWFTLSSEGGPADNFTVSPIQQLRRDAQDNVVRPSRVRSETVIQYAGLGYAISQAGDRLMWAAEHNQADEVDRLVRPRCRGKVLLRTRLASLGAFLVTIVLFVGLSILQDEIEASWIFAYLSVAAVICLILTMILCAANLAPWIGEPGPSANFYINDECTSVLHVASAFGSSDVVNVLLSCGADPNFTDLRLRTPLHYAALHGNLDACLLLVKAGASVDVRDDQDMYPYYLARQSGRLQRSKKEVERVRERVREREGDNDDGNGNGNGNDTEDLVTRVLDGPPLCLLYSIRECCVENGDDASPEEIRSIMTSHPAFLKRPAWSSNVRDMELSMVDVQDSDEDSDGDDEDSDELVQASSKQQMTTTPHGTWGMTPLMLIARHTKSSFYLMEYEMIVRDLILEHGAHVDGLHPTKGTTALHYAMLSGNRALALVFLSLGADPLRAEYKRAKTALHIACSKKGNIDIVRKMLETITGRSSTEVENDINGIVKGVVANDGNRNEDEDEDGDKEGMAISDGSLDPFDADGSTPLHNAIVSLRDVGIVRLLLSFGADPTLSGKSGFSKLGSMNTPIGWLASKGKAVHVEMLQAIAEYTPLGFNINARDPCGLSPLHLAARSGKTNVVQWMLNTYGNTIDINVRCSTSFKTAEEYASANGHVETVRTLQRWEERQDTFGEEDVGDTDGIRARKRKGTGGRT